MTGTTASSQSLGFFGSETQVRLQKLAYESRARIAETPGLFFSGRMIGIDDFDALGEAGVQTLLVEQGMLNTRLIPTAAHAPWTRRFEADNLRVDDALVLMGEAQAVRAAIAPILAAPLPEGLRLAPDLTTDDAGRFPEIQRFLVAQGLAPVYGASLAESREASTVIIEDDAGVVRAVAHTYFPHNRFSLNHRSAWGGLVAVDPALRGQGLGRIVNALMLDRAIDRLGAEHVYEIASRSNEPSRRMIESCGLSVRPDVMTSFIVPVEANQFTR
jgi:RimJ/RimL family protein N-acetyltransferase